MDTDSTTAAKEIIQNIIRSKKNLRMYPENNPIYIKTIETAYQSFTDLLEYSDSITFKIRQMEIIHEGEQVYHSPEKDDNLALFFFKDGIRELTFRKGLRKDELEDFFRIIMIDFDKEALDDDVVTLMWERDFENISYVVDEAFLTDDETYEEEAVRQAKEQVAEEDDLMRAYEDAADTEVVAGVPIAELTDEDIEAIKKELDRGTDYFVRKLSTLLFELLYLAERKEDYQELVSFFRSAIDFAFQTNQIDVVVDTFMRVGMLLDSERCPEDLKPHLQMIMAYINSERVVTLLGELLDSRTEVDEDAVNILFSLMDRTAIPALIRILGELDTIHGRRVIINSLIVLGRKDLSAVAKGLNDKRWFVVRNIIYVLRNIRDRRAVEYLVKKLRHGDIRVRKEVIKALGDLGGPHVVNYLRNYIQDADAAVRGLTAKALAQTRSLLAKRVLMEEISSSGFKSKDFDEKKEFFEAMAAWNDPDVVDFLARILRKRPFFRRQRVNENRACAAYALGLMGGAEARDLLWKFRDTGNELVREHVNEAIKRIDHGPAPERTK